MRIINLFFLLCLSPGVITLQAQSLDELLSAARQQNLELKVLEKEYLASLERPTQVSQMPDPEWGIGGFPFPVETRLGPQILRLSGTQMLPWPGLLDNKKELELSRSKALYERIQARQLEMEYEIKESYFRLYEIHRSQKIIRRNLTLLRSLEQLALSRVESGKATLADVLSVQLKIAEWEQELDILETGKVYPVTSLNQLLNRDLATPVVPTDTLLPAFLPGDKDALLAGISASHPMMRMFELQQEVSRQSIALNELSSKPSFGVGLDYIMVGKRDDAEPVNNGQDIVQLRASVRIPIFREQYEAREREENLKIDALEHQKQDLFTRFSAAIEKAYATYETARLRSELYEKQIGITQTAIRILEADYSVQGRNFDELLRLEKDLIDYDLKMLKADVQRHIAVSSIERFINP